MAVEDFYKKSREKLIRKILPIVKSKDLAEELFHDAIVTALEKYETYDSRRSKEETWFSSILFNTVWDWKRTQKRQIELVDEDVEEFLDQILSDYESSHQELVLSTENVFHKQVFYLRYLRGYGVNEIAKFLKSNPENIKKILQRVRKGL